MFGMEVIGHSVTGKQSITKVGQQLSAAQHKLQFNPHFKAKTSDIKAIFKP